MLRFLIDTCRESGMPALLILALLAAASCEKYKDEPGQGHPGLTRKYCNDPEAVNFNRDFPGTEDNSVCFYPADAFRGRYQFVDSIYNEGNKLLAERSLVLDISAVDRNKMIATGFCDGGGPAIAMTANRQLRAVVDTVAVYGQTLCRAKDTLSGIITQSLSDSTRLRVFLRVVSDTNVTLHQGTAYRQ